jgi:hypothetical protein
MGGACNTSGVYEKHSIMVDNLKMENHLGYFGVDENIISSRVLVTETGSGMVIGFINHLHVIITITSNNVPDLYTYNHSNLIFSVCSSRIYHIGTIQV